MAKKGRIVICCHCQKAMKRKDRWTCITVGRYKALQALYTILHVTCPDCKQENKFWTLFKQGG